MLKDKGYPMGWKRVPGMGNYDHFEAIEWFASLLGLNTKDAKFTPGSYEAIRATGEIGAIPFTESDKAWYKPYQGMGL